MEHPRELARRLTWVHGSALAIGAVLGSGILVLPATTAQQAGPAAIVAWIIMSVLAFPLSLTLGQLAAQHPHAGGIVEYVRLAWGNSASRLTAWLFLGTIPIGVPIIAILGADYTATTLALPTWTIPLIAALMLAGSLGLHAAGVEVASWMQIAVLAIIGALIVIAILFAAPHIHPRAFHPFVPHGWLPVGQATVSVFWCFVGWEMVGHLAEEFLNPRKDLQRTFLVAPSVVGLLYVALAFVTIGIHAYGRTELPIPFSQLLATGFGQSGPVLAGWTALVITIVSIHGNIGGFSRMVFSQARAGVFPRFLSHVHRIRRIPTAALWALALDFAVVLTIDTMVHINLPHLILLPSTVFLVLYTVAMISAVKLFAHVSKKKFVLMAGLAAIVCVALLPFSGWALLYPLSLITAGWFVSVKRRPARNVE
ncbi:APC family permease [Sulfobacillus sp. hq2]|uniref:Amino acid permease n=1 Tax=Sulfobacillus thermotolerans TaxID=338644 RepID=A0ABN5H3F5_9FIRM|nr:amino acid permease [Sulfobacillus sp. hq2]AUW95260.1 hypothetical protein BXT84_15925 [Sulfobacillus thermotolerans]POB11826.1 hypothetical protein CO251_02490 [Sulfobacillus sp. hq2]